MRHFFLNFTSLAIIVSLPSFSLEKHTFLILRLHVSTIEYGKLVTKASEDIDSKSDTQS